ncbi:hypothetical protein BGM09_31795 [Streptomyces sp. CBMA29]|nr:hypothetical protein [Streptomyces sp. CBMA29]
MTTNGLPAPRRWVRQFPSTLRSVSTARHRVREAGIDDERGRGLALVAALAKETGHHLRVPVGKTVWARLELGAVGALEDPVRRSAGRVRVDEGWEDLAMVGPMCRNGGDGDGEDSVPGQPWTPPPPPPPDGEMPEGDGEHRR